MSFNYIGSKKSLLEFVNIPISKITTDASKTYKLLDGFAGTGVIGMYFQNKYKNITIIANDLEYYSYIVNFSQLTVSYSDKLKDIITDINSKLNNEFKHKKNYKLISNNYTPAGTSDRMFWTEENGHRADYVKYLMDKYLKEDKIDNNEYIFLNASLLSSMDKVANTASVYGAFLKQFKKTALGKMEIKPIHTNTELNNNSVFNCDINSNTILDIEYDIVYLDPPYNQRQYSVNYHPLNYIAKYDDTIEVYGKTGLIKDSNKSKYCIKKEAYDTLNHLISNLKTKHILLSYNNEGIIDFEKIKTLLTKFGKVVLYKKVYKKFKSNNEQVDETVYEYLFHLKIGTNKQFIEVIV